jgi:hypothetical protein
MSFYDCLHVFWNEKVIVPNLGEWNGYSDGKNTFTVNALRDQRGTQSCSISIKLSETWKTE